MYQYYETPVVKQFIPSTIELEKIIEETPPKFVYKFDFLVYLIQLLYVIPMKNKKTDVVNGYVPYNAQLLQKFERNYRPHLNYLIEQGILEEYSSYTPGIRSRGYRLAEKYLDGHLREIVVTDAKIAEKLTLNQKVDFDATINYKYLHRWFNSNLTIDTINAFDYCYNEVKEKKHTDYYKAYSDAYSKMMKLKFIENGYFWFTVDTSGNRLHTNLTNLDSSLKPFISYEDKDLVSIDIKNSQPFVSIKVLRDFYLSNPIIQPTNPSTPIILVKTLEQSLPRDVQQYIDLVASGQFYEFMVTKFKDKFGDAYFMRPEIFDYDKKRMVKNTKPPRKQVKTAMFCIFFSQNKWVVKEKKLFKEIFPNVMLAFEEVKKYQHNTLACNLQQIEASIILDGACKEISLNRPQLPLFTIHDSIVTTVGNEDYVKAVLIKHFHNEIGYTPQVELDYWRDENSMAA